jgi:hypothetical protein
MISQIFKQRVEKEILFNFLDKIASKGETKYIFDNTSYKRSVFLDILKPFLDDVRPYYHVSKQAYVDKKHSFKMLSTIIRQICRLHGIYYKQEIKYAKSTYEIVYHIYFPDEIFSQI